MFKSLFNRDTLSPEQKSALTQANLALLSRTERMFNISADRQGWDINDTKIEKPAPKQSLHTTGIPYRL